MFLRRGLASRVGLGSPFFFSKNLPGLQRLSTLFEISNSSFSLTDKIDASDFMLAIGGIFRIGFLVDWLHP